MDVIIRRYEDNDGSAVGALRARMPAADGLRAPDREGIGAGPQFCLVATAGRDIVAATWATQWLEADGTRLWLLTGGVDPAWRSRGIGRRLLARLETIARTAAAQQPEPAARIEMYGANANEDQPSAIVLLKAAGYQIAFTVVSMEMDPAGRQPVPLPDGFAERPIGKAEHRRICAAIDECFDGTSHGHTTHTWEDYQADVAAGQRDTGLWCVAWDGEQVAGLVIVERLDDTTGDVPWVAVRAPWRGRGLARAMLTTSIARCANTAMTTLRIETIQENVNRTVAFYESLGFTVVRRQPRWRKPVSKVQGMLSSWATYPM